MVNVQVLMVNQSTQSGKNGDRANIDDQRQSRPSFLFHADLWGSVDYCPIGIKYLFHSWRYGSLVRGSSGTDLFEGG